MNPLEIFAGSDGKATVALYEALRSRGPLGHISECLFRAQKMSSRAKINRRRFRGQTYENKQSSMDQVSRMLARHGEALGFRYGWKEDPEVLFGERASWVLYVDIAVPSLGILRQVSFHSPQRGEGPDYQGEWDGARGASEQRVIELAAYVLTLPVTEEGAVIPFGKHRGEKLSDVPLEYLKWFATIDTLKPELKQAVKEAIESRESQEVEA
jgi:Putative quorum-sensing-regulated virulence factor